MCFTYALTTALQEKLVIGLDLSYWSFLRIHQEIYYFPDFYWYQKHVFNCSFWNLAKLQCVFNL